MNIVMRIIWCTTYLSAKLKHIIHQFFGIEVMVLTAYSCTDGYTYISLILDQTKKSLATVSCNVLLIGEINTMSTDHLSHRGLVQE